MSITIHPPLETELRAQAKAEGITVEAYLERLVNADREVAGEIEKLSLEGLNSGDPIEMDGDHWQQKHARLDNRIHDNRAR